jgi:transcriptional regulator with XRE-family HTH domain
MSKKPPDDPKKIRQTKGITIEAMAFKFDLAVKTLGRFERKTLTPTIRTRNKIAAAYGQTVEWVDAWLTTELRCQFCSMSSPATQWKEEKCPRCGAKYDAILAQEGDD